MGRASAGELLPHTSTLRTVHRKAFMAYFFIFYSLQYKDQCQSGKYSDLQGVELSFLIHDVRLLSVISAYSL